MSAARSRRVAVQGKGTKARTADLPLAVLREFYEFGHRVLKRCGVRTGTRYRPGILQEIAKENGTTPDRCLKARVCATAYSREEFEVLYNSCVEHVIPPGTLWLLATVQDRRSRRRLQRSAVRERWSMRRLAMEIRKVQASRSPAGRRFGAPRDTQDVLVQIEQFADSWHRWNRGVEDPNATFQLPESVQKQLKLVNTNMRKLQDAAVTALDRKGDA
jgi:hypothetical protein